MAFSTGGQNLVCSGVSFNTSLVAAIRASVKALRSSGLSLAWEACCAYAEPATKKAVTSPTAVFNIGISWMFTGFTPKHAGPLLVAAEHKKNVDKDSWDEDHVRGRWLATRELVRSTLVGDPRATGYLVANLGSITFLCGQCSLRGGAKRFGVRQPPRALRPAS